MPRVNKAQVEHTVEELKRLRYSFAGFAAAGGKLPLCIQSITDPLWLSQRFLSDLILDPMGDLTEPDEEITEEEVL